MEVLKRPLVTEKLTQLGAKGRYGFVVDPRANKLMIRRAIEEAYGVTVLDVNTMQCAGKRLTRPRRIAVSSARGAERTRQSQFG